MPPLQKVRIIGFDALNYNFFTARPSPRLCFLTLLPHDIIEADCKDMPVDNGYMVYANLRIQQS